MSVLQPQPCLDMIGLGSSPFARRYLGNHYYFLFLQVLRCFSSLGVLPFGFPFFKWEGYPIRKSTLKRVFASQCSLSQLITSFIAVKSLGIPQLLLFAYKYFSLPICQRTFPLICGKLNSRSRTEFLFRCPRWANSILNTAALCYGFHRYFSLTYF